MPKTDTKTKLTRALAKLAFWLMSSCLLLVLLPASLLTRLHLNELVAQYRSLLGLLLILAAGYLFCYCLNTLLEEVIAFVKKYHVNKQIRLKVLSLDVNERALLREFFLRGTAVLRLPFNERVVKALFSARIIELQTDIPKFTSRFSSAEFKITPMARQHLNRRVLGLPAGNLTQDDIHRLKQTRPKFIQQLRRVRRFAA